MCLYIYVGKWLLYIIRKAGREREREDESVANVEDKLAGSNLASLSKVTLHGVSTVTLQR